MKTTAKKFTCTVKTTAHELLSRRQNANYERFIQQQANVFQVTEMKDQAMFWVMN